MVLVLEALARSDVLDIDGNLNELCADSAENIVQTLEHVILHRIYTKDQSVTHECPTHSIRLGDSNNNMLSIIDVASNIDSIVSYVKGNPSLDAICILLEPNLPRLYTLHSDYTSENSVTNFHCKILVAKSYFALRTVNRHSSHRAAH